MDKETQIKPLTVDEAIKLYKEIVGEPESDVGEKLPTNPPPEDVTKDQLRSNLTRWRSLRHTGCIHMHGVIAMVESHGDAVWYFNDALQDISNIVLGGFKYEAEGALDPSKSKVLMRETRRG